MGKKEQAPALAIFVRVLCGCACGRPTSRGRPPDGWGTSALAASSTQDTSQTHDAIFKTRETTPQTSNCGVSFCFCRSLAGLSQPQAPRARAARESRLVTTD